MAEIANWNNHSFTVSADLIRGFTKLTIKGGSATEEKISGKESYITRKAGQPLEVTLTVALYAQFGCDVQAEALAFIDEAAAGAKSYFYVGGQKLTPYMLMLISASVADIQITGGGKWASCNIDLTLKQCAKGGNGGSGSSGGSGKKKSGGSGGGGGGKDEIIVEPASYTTASLFTAMDETGKQVALNALTGKTEPVSKAGATVMDAITYVHENTARAKAATRSAKTGSGTLASTAKTATKVTQGKLVAAVNQTR